MWENVEYLFENYNNNRPEELFYSAGAANERGFSFEIIVRAWPEFQNLFRFDHLKWEKEEKKEKPIAVDT